jgi:uncharacterized protein (TIGR02266 family)
MLIVIWGIISPSGCFAWILYRTVDLFWQDVVKTKVVERRKNSRIPVSLEVTFDSGEQVLSSYLFDIGEGGIFIGTPDPLEEGSPIRLCFHLPGMSNSLLVMGTVIWRQGSGDSSRPGMGIKFD